jgi:hypothetical protein
MPAKVYVLLDLVHSDSLRVTRILREKPGVAIVDVLEGPPDIIMTIEATERQEAAQYLMNALASVDDMTENLRVLPVHRSAGKKSHRDCKASQGMVRRPKRTVTSRV